MNFTNPVDITGFMDTYDPSQAIKAKSRAQGFLNAKAEQGKATVGGAGLQSVSKLIADQHLKDAQNYADNQAKQANLFGSAMNLVGGLGSIGVSGGFGSGSGTNPYSGEFVDFGMGSDSLAIGSPSSFGGGKMYDIDFTKIW